VQTSFRVEPGLGAKIRTVCNRYLLGRSRIEFWYGPEMLSDHDLTMQPTESKPHVDIQGSSY